MQAQPARYRTPWETRTRPAKLVATGVSSCRGMLLSGVLCFYPHEMLVDNWATCPSPTVMLLRYLYKCVFIYNLVALFLAKNRLPWKAVNLFSRTCIVSHTVCHDLVPAKACTRRYGNTFKAWSISERLQTTRTRFMHSTFVVWLKNRWLCEKTQASDVNMSM